MVIVRVPGAGWSTRVHGRAVAVTIALCGAAFLAFAWSLSVGDYPIALSDVLATLFGGGNEDTAFIIRRLSLPRGLTAALVGAGDRKSVVTGKSVSGRVDIGGRSIIKSKKT